MTNPDVRAEIMRVMGYWLQLGVAGFRVDAVPFVIQDSPLTRRKTPKLHFDWLEEMRRFLQWRSRDAIMLGEANVLPKDNMRYFGDEGQGIQMMFNFFVNQHLFYALASEDVGPLAGGACSVLRTSRTRRNGRNRDLALRVYLVPFVLLLRPLRPFGMSAVRRSAAGRVAGVSVRQRMEKMLVHEEVEHHVKAVAILPEIAHVLARQYVRLAQQDGSRGFASPASRAVQ